MFFYFDLSTSYPKGLLGVTHLRVNMLIHLMLRLELSLLLEKYLARLQLE